MDGHEVLGTTLSVRLSLGFAGWRESMRSRIGLLAMPRRLYRPGMGEPCLDSLGSSGLGIGRRVGECEPRLSRESLAVERRVGDAPVFVKLPPALPIASASRFGDPWPGRRLRGGGKTGFWPKVALLFGISGRRWLSSGEVPGLAFMLATLVLDTRKTGFIDATLLGRIVSGDGAKSSDGSIIDNRPPSLSTTLFRFTTSNGLGTGELLADLELKEGSISVLSSGGEMRRRGGRLEDCRFGLLGGTMGGEMNGSQMAVSIVSPFGFRPRMMPPPWPPVLLSSSGSLTLYSVDSDEDALLPREAIDMHRSSSLSPLFPGDS
ncbi:hypothetical protein CGLO_04234 [Colletotrichum gloeosporioides Cg-14]|uniref:Uncharacterized protein n=1 Tax=Colletotrichum gloeosporioides (strain Cg-14) TaxID=1237896 RepID=T0M4S6_COLGC|nr:hypothetical protein CGLO_04234 [Colletotrichum gloeosporioides Cg-14]